LITALGNLCTSGFAHDQPLRHSYAITAGHCFTQVLLDSGESFDGEDLFHAAMVFQHGSQLGDWRRAHELALQAVALHHEPAKWLAAAALDRWLVNLGRPHKYGTQYRMAGGKRELGDVDPSTSDERTSGVERAQR